MLSNPIPAPRTITKAQFITEKVSLLADMFLSSGSRKADLNYNAYVDALSFLPVENLRSAFTRATRECRYMPLPVELRELAHYKPEQVETKIVHKSETKPASDLCLCGFSGIPHMRGVARECIWTKYKHILTSEQCAVVLTSEQCAVVGIF